MSNDNDGHHVQLVDQPSTDLTYLHPDNVRIGSIGVFAGDWARTGEPARISVGFVGTLIDHSDRGVVWRCTREVADAVVADQQRLRDAERKALAAQGVPGADLDDAVDDNFPPLFFDGDVLVLDETVRCGQGAIDRVRPGGDGRYPINFGWTWTAVDPADCDRIAGALPAFGEHREYVMATHQPLRMPHDRLTVNEVLAAPASDRVDYAATLSLDGNTVGTVGHTRAGAVEFYPLRREFGLADLEAFVRDCRWRGRQVDTQTVLQVLIAECQTTTHLAAAEAQGLIAVIVRDGDDHIVGTDIVLEPRPFAPGDRQSLAELFTGREAVRRPGQNQFVWQVWTGRRWQMLGIVDAPRDPARTEQQVPGADRASTVTGSADHPTTTPDPESTGPDVPDTDGTELRGEDQ